MSGEGLKLLGTRPSAYVWRIIWALKWKGLEFEFIEEDFYNKSSLLLEMNPVHKKIPVLVHLGKPISESLVILEYIDETWKSDSFMPQEPQERAYARFWAKFADENFLDLASQIFATAGEEQEKAVEKVKESMEILEREISGKKFFGGENLGYLDLVIGWSAYWLKFAEEIACFKVMDPEKYPCLNFWMKKFLEVPLIKNNLPTPDEILGSLRPFRNVLLANIKG